MKKPAILWEPRADGRVLCYACARKCLIPSGSHGFCYVRENNDGKLYLSVYGKLAAMQIDPIEKKPFNHFHPGTHVFTVGTVSCNWHCHPAGTRITLADGTTMTVEKLEAGDALWSYDVVDSDVSKSVPRPNVVTEIRTRKAELWAVWWGGTSAVQKKRRRKTFITGDHPVLTREGWKQVQDLKPGDYLLRVWAQISSNRKTVQKHAKFECKNCGQAVNGVAEWATHRNVCYASKQIMPESQKAIIREMMTNRNPMRNPEVAQRQGATIKMKLLADPSYSLHKNVERFRASLHKHPSKAQLILYEVLNELGLEYEQEHVLRPEKRLPESESAYILDAALVNDKLDLEVDGWWHFNSEEVKRRDRIRDATLELNGWKIVRIPGSSVYIHAPEIRQLVTAQIQNRKMKNDKQWVRLQDVKRTGQFTTVYGFECIPNHTYVADGILVHNCSFCQNHNISKETEVYGEDVPPQEVPAYAKEHGCEGVGFSYNEPTIFIEYVIDAAREAHNQGLYTVFVTNGYSTPEAVQAVKGYIDAAVIDYKGSGELMFQRKQTMTVSADPIKEALLEYKRQGIHTELTDLIIPEVGESLEEAEKLCKWLYDNLGPDIPIQFTAFHPDYKLLNIQPTPYELLVKHYEAAKKIGLNYVYIGNAPGTPYEHTYCPGCQKPVIERYAYIIKSWNLDVQNRCKFCGYQIPITGHRAKRFSYRDIESFYIPNPKALAE